VSSPVPAAFVEVEPEHTVAQKPATEFVDASAPPSSLSQLNSDLAEAKQLRANVLTAEQALGADVTLLRESAQLEKVATSTGDRAAAHKQVIEAEKIVKEAEILVKDSRDESIARARDALVEASAVQKAADELTAAAEAELQGKPHRKTPTATVEPPQPEVSHMAADEPSQREVAAEESSQPEVPVKPVVKPEPKVHTKKQQLRKVKKTRSAHSPHSQKKRSVPAASPVVAKKKESMQAKVAAHKKAPIHSKAATQPKHPPSSPHVQKETIVKAKAPAPSAHAQNKVFVKKVATSPPAHSQKLATTKKASAPPAQTPHVQKKVPVKPTPPPPKIASDEAPQFIFDGGKVIRNPRVHVKIPPTAPPKEMPTVTADTDTDSDNDSDSDDDSSSNSGPTVQRQAASDEDDD
jgi:hypothetical protein